MRPLTVHTFTSLDGVMQAPGGPAEDPSEGFDLGGWLVPFADEDMGGAVGDWFSRAGDFLLGRRTYDIFAAHWPHVTDGDPVSTALNAKTKHVVSRGRPDLTWSGARLVDGDPVDGIRALKSGDGGGELQVHGSATLLQTLLAHDLVDELRLIVFPVALGRGRRLFGDTVPPTAFTLLGASTTSTGAVVATYRPAGRARTGDIAIEDGHEVTRT